MIRNMNRIVTMFIYRRDKWRGKVCGNILDVNAFTLYPFPKAFQGIGTLAFANMQDTPASQVNNYCLVYVSFPYGELVYADTVNTV